jgi:hypothetical protein
VTYLTQTSPLEGREYTWRSRGRVCVAIGNKEKQCVCGFCASYYVSKLLKPKRETEEKVGGVE